MFKTQNINLLPKNMKQFRKSDTNLVYIFTNARDEPNIAEWIAHHILLGFDKVFVFDHLSKEPINTKIKTNFDNKLIIKNVSGTGSIKIRLMKEAVAIARANNVSWILYLDADEFLLLKNGIKNVKDLLKNFPYADSIGINWLFFGSSGHVTQPKGLITENFIKSEIRLDKHVKTFVRPSTVTDVINPHFYLITSPSRSYAVTGTKMNVGPFNYQPLPFIKTPAYIAHYYIQSEQEYCRRKGRNADDGTGSKSTDIKDTLKRLYNDVVNNQLQYKYSKNITGFLKKYSIEI
jgi:hypothetical protein